MNPLNTQRKKDTQLRKIYSKFFGLPFHFRKSSPSTTLGSSPHHPTSPISLEEGRNSSLDQSSQSLLLLNITAIQHPIPHLVLYFHLFPLYITFLSSSFFLSEPNLLTPLCSGIPTPCHAPAHASCSNPPQSRLNPRYLDPAD